jgi:hypothetical protein
MNGWVAVMSVTMSLTPSTWLIPDLLAALIAAPRD